MSLRETDVRELSSQDHQVLGSDFCSGYTDIFGKWNTGFDCPRMGNGETVYCCGTTAYKYCCTRRDQHSGANISQSVLLGSALGSVLMIVLVALVSCLICRRCGPYRRAHPSLNGGPLYTMHCSSTTSGIANMYPFSGQHSATTTPLDALPTILVDNPDQAYTIPMNTQRGLSRHPSDPPPPYNEVGGTILQNNSPTTNRFDLRAARIGLTSQQRYPTNHQSRRQPGNDAPTNALYWSTKF